MATFPIPPEHEIKPVEQVPVGGSRPAADDVPRLWTRAELDALVADAVALANGARDRRFAEAISRAGLYGGVARGTRL